MGYHIPFLENLRRRIIGFAGFAFLLIYQGCGGGIEVECVKPSRGEIQESFSEPAKTRLDKTYPITMPVTGRIGYIDLEPGDEVRAGQELVQFDLVPFEEELKEAKAAFEELQAQLAVQDFNKLEETVKTETIATVEATKETLKASEAQIEAETVRSNHATKDYQRIQALAKEQSVSQSQLDQAQMEAETALIALRTQEFNHASMKAILTAIQLGPNLVDEYLTRKQLERHVYLHQLVQAEARLAKAEHSLKLAAIRSPIDGVVLERYSLGDSPLNAGTELLLLGNLDQMEVVSDVLTQDALKLSQGGNVILEPAARMEPIEGKVKKIEPAGFTKLSSLGVEQQRVNVIVDLEDRPENLGVGYRLQAEFITGSKKNVLIIPRSCVMQSVDETYYVWTVQDGALRKKNVTIGLRSDLELEILTGLSEKDTLVLHPDVNMEEGMSVTVKSS